ncbi:MAG: cation:proton antiporter [Pseudanabaena sp. M57BS1SP1A06MG]|nr:cation:proton antiporter [Pseudanabaena sp. M53BS1SP1A06MG]MCA6583148.1 cation:proton antiporter [Pseudanabaena sp. M34BS1SP1A06MG]MCA6590728.1 cation:proton antiporter [Pseudanabaena sp. M38BS1SP1A06MG]MCA6595536.1 cation:proton antiporter [Pseudanabaena sp. M046S1SP1A06QC]MCA6600083.1 cation:proton antiporter [Pseudanabaena sp. M57BS1SP1A06MG]
MESSLSLIIIIAIAAGISARVIANFFRVPSIVFLLLFGVALGGNGFNLVQPRLLGDGLEAIVSISVALILFDGGLNLKLQELGKVSASLRNLITVGTLITLIGGGIAAYWLSEFPWTIAFLYAALVVVTGPTVINPIVEEVGLDRRLATILEGEGVLIDAIGSVLAVVVLDVALNPAAGSFEVVMDLGLRLGVGGTVGAIAGWLLGRFLQRATFLAEDTKSAVVVAAVLALFGLAQEIQSESGLTAVVVMGIILRASEIPNSRALLKFKSQLVALIVSVLFILLSANLSIPSIFALGWGGVQTVLFMMLIVRPINVIVSTWNSSFTWRQKAFLAWCAPRGIVAASVASLFSILLTERGVNGGESVKALVFLTIAMTVFLQGLSAKLVAKLLGLSQGDISGLVIVGSNPIGILVARLFQANGHRVALIDTNAEFCKQAAEYDIPAFVSNGLDAKSLAEAGLDSVGTFVALTINTDVNIVIAQLAIKEFNPPKVFAIYVKEVESDRNQPEVQQAFSNRVPIKTWNQYILQREVRVGEFLLISEEIEEQLNRFNTLFNAGILLPLLFERKGQLQIVSADMNWEKGDRIVYLLYTPKTLPQAQFEVFPPNTLDITPVVLSDLDIAQKASDSNSSSSQKGKKVLASSNSDYFLSMAKDILKRRS